LRFSPAIRPISQYVLKVHSRCDLACDHCYVYEHADQSWRTRPHRTAPAIARQAASRIADHAAAHHLPDVSVVLHGGEPLLLGEQGLREVLATLRTRIDPVTRLELSIHTNGVLLSPRLCEVFDEYGVRVGVSLDGDRAANDRHRRYANGQSSHAEVTRALELLRRPEFRHLYAGLLCTIDIANDPIAVYQALLAEEPPRLDFLLPHATWENPPRRDEVPTPYADWLGRIFEHWAAHGRPVPIRLFDSIEAALRGEPSLTEGIGLDPVDLLVIETDGTWEQVDSLKTAYAGAAGTDLDVFTHSVDEAAAHPAVAARQQGLDVLCDTCRECPVVQGCGGGLYSHRYRARNGFDNPSVYCDDLKLLVTGIAHENPVPTHSPAAAAAAPSTSSPAPDLPAADVDLLAQGPLAPDAVARFSASQESLTRLLFAQVGALATREAERREPIAVAGWELLCALDEQAPDAVRALYRHPHARAWAVRCLAPPPDADRVRDLMHLAAFAAAGAVHAGIPADLVVPVDGDRLYLPTLGTALFDDGKREQIQLTLHAGVREFGDRWLPARAIGSAPEGLRLENMDPYRDCYEAPVMGTLTEAAARTWERTTADAHDLLVRAVPAHAAQLDAALRSIVPLAQDPTGADRSAASRHAFGSAGVALPADGQALAPLLVHEVQHMLLDAVLDLHDLVEPSHRRRMHVPWREDSRPVSGVLHGAFAHLSMAEVWKGVEHCGTAERPAPGTQAARAATLNRRYSDWSADALDALLLSGALTPGGERFALRLAERVRRVRAEA
jgi:uncharacterized protein